VDADQHGSPAVRRMVVTAHIVIPGVVVSSSEMLATVHIQLVAVGTIHR
jgi:hypothetical protein